MEISIQLKRNRNERVPNRKTRGTHFLAIWSGGNHIFWAQAPSASSAELGRARLTSAELGRGRPCSKIKDFDCWPSSAELDGARPALKILCIFLIFQRIPGRPGTPKNHLFCKKFLTVEQLPVFFLFVIRTRRMVHTKKVKYWVKDLEQSYPKKQKLRLLRPNGAPNTNSKCSEIGKSGHFCRKVGAKVEFPLRRSFGLNSIRSRACRSLNRATRASPPALQ